MEVLLVEPPYKVKLPPLGLMRISSYHKSKGDKVTFFKGVTNKLKADKIYISTLFTYDYEISINTVRYYKQNYPDTEIIVGGVLATLMPHKFDGVKVVKGLFKEAEDFPPDYSLFPNLDYSITYTSRGCIRKCSFCAVSKIEPEFKSRDWLKDIDTSKKSIVFLDNNWLGKSKEDWEADVKLLFELKKKHGIHQLDFNQALDSRLITEDHFKRLKGLRIKPIRFAFDNMTEDGYTQKAIQLSKKYHFPKVVIDVLYNFNDSPEEFYYRVKEVVKNGATAFPMRYSPLDQLDKEYLGKNWTKKERDTIQLINPYTRGQIVGNLKLFNEFFGRNAKEFKRYLNYKKIGVLNSLRMEKLMLKQAERLRQLPRIT